MIITVNDANKLIFAADDMEVTYLNYFLTANVKMRKAPFMYEEKMYVPIDDFIQVIGGEGFYEGKNELGKEALYLVPPQKTVMDDLSEF